MSHIVLVGVLLIFATTVHSQHTYTDAFPTYDEYDYTILDPRSAYGSPYGGFSRATASRLAALPLHLPPVSEENPTDNPLYMKVRDFWGRLYACRVYHEDELDPNTIHDSMFDAPVLRSVSESSSAYNEEKKELVGGNGLSEVIDINSDTEDIKSSFENFDMKFETNANGKRTFKMTNEKTGNNHIDLFMILAADTQIRALRNVCGHLHLGWWSYEWCFESHVSQFHIDLKSDTEQLKITDITGLGKFSSRKIINNLSNEPVNELAGGLEEFARIEDTHIGGDVCETTGKLRKSKVIMLCCSDEVLASGRGKILKKNSGTQDNTKVAIIHSVEENQEELCSYQVTVCTSLLCVDHETHGDKEKKKKKSKLQARKIGAESVREILDRVLSDICLQSIPGGWWTYEVCHGSKVRQFHESIVAHKTQSGATLTNRVVESEHILGLYIQEDASNLYPNEDEWQHVVNVTDSAKGLGNGAYFEIEYTDGDVCDHSDVTDAAVIAGSTGTGGIARASSVRYFCGSNYDVTVREDSTCHYIVEVQVPDLCSHPLFKAPVSKRQIVKCLPANGDEDWSNNFEI